MLYIPLNLNASIPLSHQISSFLRSAVLEGKLKANEKLPSSRALAVSLRVSRNTVIQAYDQLLAEGYLFTKNGSGTYVNQGVFLGRKDHEGESGTKGRKLISEGKTSFPEIFTRKAQIENGLPLISFRTGIPDLKSIPIRKWGRYYREVTQSIPPDLLDYQEPFGSYGLRRELAQYLWRSRGVCAGPEQILLTGGAAQAFSLLCRFFPESRYALVENPLSFGILHTLQSYHIPLKTIPLDKDGMITSLLPSKPPHFIFTTPSHQFPTGVLLPACRRTELIHYARKHGCYIVEDDYDSEFRFDGSPVQAMQGLDPDCVIYTGTFSKSFMPALRIGYLVLPPSLLSTMKEAKYTADLHSPVLEQLTMAAFIKDGELELHIQKMKKLYLKRQNYLTATLKENFKNRVCLTGMETGMHLAASFQDCIFDQEKMQELKSLHLQIAPLSSHYLPSAEYKYEHRFDSCLVFGYGNTGMEDILSGILRLKKLLL